MNTRRTLLVCLLLVIFSVSLTSQQEPSQQPAVQEWVDTFDTFDAAKWEKFSFEGPSGAKTDLKDGVLQVRGLENARAGVRTVQKFSADRFIVEASLPQPPRSPLANQHLSFSSLAVLFDTAGRNRIEWIFRSDGRFEAWFVRDGRSERLDGNKLATKETKVNIAIVRRGDTLMFVLNGEVGLEKKVGSMPRDFHVMLYGWSTSESYWDSVRVVAAN